MNLILQRVEHTGDPASLWRVDEVRAALEDGTPAGYLRISYIPSERTPGWQEDIYVFLAHRGSSLGIYGIKDPATANHDQWSSLAFRVQERLQSWANACASKWDDRPLADIQTFLEQSRAALEDKLGPKRDEFLEFHVDKPLVDYIEVPEGLRGKRISRTLYQEAARWMEERGLALHASGVQTEAAQRCWSSMRRDGLVQDAGATRVRLKPF